MADRYDVIVIGAGLGGLTAAALLARAGRKVLLIERNHNVGGAASTYKAGDLVVEASLHETADPNDPREPRHRVLATLGVLDEVEWVPTGSFYEVRGGPVGAPFVMPDNFARARDALTQRFPAARAGIGSVLGDMERIATGLGTLSQRRDAFRSPLQGFSALTKLTPMLTGWRLSVSDRFARSFGSDEAVKCALAANLPYYHDDPDTLWWIFFAVAQGGFLNSGARYVRGGSQRLSLAFARVIRSAGGEILRGRIATEIVLDRDGRASGVAHESAHGGDRVEVAAPVVVSNAAPAVMANLLPESARASFFAPYARRPLSIALFSATFGLSARPAEFGFTSYSTLLLPKWMSALADFKRSAALLAGAPGDQLPPMAIVDYSAIDSGLGGPPFPLSAVGVDRMANWAGLDAAGYKAKRDRWRDAIVGAIEAEYPGFAAKVVASTFSTASTMHSYLNAPDGAIYGFAPLPPAGPIWKGIDRSPKTPVEGLFLASSYAGSGGFTGAIMAGAAAAERVLAGA